MDMTEEEGLWGYLCNLYMNKYKLRTNWSTTFLVPRKDIIEDRMRRFVVDVIVMSVNFAQNGMLWFVVQSLGHQWALGSSITVL